MEEKGITQAQAEAQHAVAVKVADYICDWWAYFFRYVPCSHILEASESGAFRWDNRDGLTPILTHSIVTQGRGTNPAGTALGRHCGQCYNDFADYLQSARVRCDDLEHWYKETSILQEGD